MMLRITLGWWQESPITRETTKETVKTIRAGNAGCFRFACGVELVCFLSLRTRLRVGLNTRHSLRPLFQGQEFLSKLARMTRRDGEGVPAGAGIASEAVQYRPPCHSGARVSASPKSTVPHECWEEWIPGLRLPRKIALLFVATAHPGMTAEKVEGWS